MFEDPWNNQQQLVDLEATSRGVRITLPRENAESTDLSMPSKIVSQTRRETLPHMSTELHVYTKHGFNPNIENLPIYPEHGQSSSPNSSIPGNLPINPTPLSCSDLDVPIAIRKGVRNYTKHPIDNYLSYY